jgi:hypothetical protein
VVALQTMELAVLAVRVLLLFALPPKTSLIQAV